MRKEAVKLAAAFIALAMLFSLIPLHVRFETNAAFAEQPAETAEVTAVPTDEPVAAAAEETEEEPSCEPSEAPAEPAAVVEDAATAAIAEEHEISEEPCADECSPDITAEAETPTEETTEMPAEMPAEIPTEAPATVEEEAPEMRSGYIMLSAGTPLWADKERTELLGHTEDEAYFYVESTKVDAPVYKVLFDTEETCARSECHAAYVKSVDAIWLGDACEDALINELTADNARVVEGNRIPEVDFRYNRPEETADAEATEENAEESAEESAEEPVEEHIEEPADDAQATDVPSEEEMPVLEPEQAVESQNEADPEEMRAALDETHPERQIFINAMCSDMGFAIGADITLEAVAVGYDGLEYRIIWEVDRGSGWENAGFDGETIISFTITEENLSWNWRAGVSMPYTENTEE